MYRDGYFGGYLGLPTGLVVLPNRPTGVKLRFRAFLALEDPGQPPTWHELTENELRPGWTIRSGKSAALDDVQAGTFAGTFDNRNGWLSKTNDDSPFAGGLLANRRLRIGADMQFNAVPFVMRRSVVGGTDVLRGAPMLTWCFTGYTGDDFVQRWDIGGSDASVAIGAVDELGLMEPPDTPAFSVGGTIGDAILQVLAYYGFPGVVPGMTSPVRNAYVDIDQGTITLADAAPMTGSYLETLRKLALTEGGSIFIDGAGRFVFRAADRTDNLAGTWGDAPELGELPYSDITDAPLTANIWNAITVTDGTDSVTRTSPSSIQQNRIRSRTFEVFRGPDLAARCDALIDRYGEPRPRIAGFAPLGRDDTRLWHQILGRQLASLVGVKKRPPAGTTIDRVAHIEGRTISGPKGKEVRVSWDISQDPVLYPNVLSEVESSFESDPFGWSAEAACVLTRADPTILTILQPFPHHPGGNLVHVGFAPVTGLWVMSMELTDTEGSALPATSGVVEAGQSWRAGISVATSIAPGIATHLELEWRSASGAVLDADVGEEVAVYPTRAWHRLVVEAIAPAGAAAVFMRLAGIFTKGGPLPNVLSNTVFADGAYMKRLS